MNIEPSRQFGVDEHVGIFAICKQFYSNAVGNLWFYISSLEGFRLLYFFNEKEGVYFDKTQEAFAKEMRNMLTIWEACSSTTGIFQKKLAEMATKSRFKTYLETINLSATAFNVTGIRQ